MTRPDLRTAYWTKVVRPHILLRDRWCPGVPPGIHAGELVRTNSVDHIEPGRALTGSIVEDRKYLRGLCDRCNSRRASAEQGAYRWTR